MSITSTNPRTTGASSQSSRGPREVIGSLLSGRSRASVVVQMIAAAIVIGAFGFIVANEANPELLAVFTVALCYIMLSLGANVMVGWSGLVTFGQAAFFGCGSYTVALTRNMHWSAQVVVVLAIAVAAVLGFIVFWLLSHYTHIAFAMLTLVFGQFVVLLVSNTKKLGSSDGFGGILRENALGSPIITDVDFWWFAFIVLLVALAAYWWTYRRVFALRLFASREDAGRLETLGYNVRTLRATAGSMSAAVSAAGGAVYAIYNGAVSPTALGFELSGAAVFMCIIGGSQYLWGPTIGAILYTLTVNYWLQSNDSATMYLGAIFVIVMIVLPGGILSIVAVARTMLSRVRRRRRTHATTESGVLA